MTSIKNIYNVFASEGSLTIKLCISFLFVTMITAITLMVILTYSAIMHG